MRSILVGIMFVLSVAFAYGAFAGDSSHTTPKMDPFQWLQAPDEDSVEWDRRLDNFVEDRIECWAPSFLLRVIVPGGNYEIMPLDQSSIKMCGWKTNLFEMFVVDRKGCIVEEKHRWWMNNMDAKRVRECFEEGTR